jgi:hypothetical protein
LIELVSMRKLPRDSAYSEPEPDDWQQLTLRYTRILRGTW